MRLRADMKQSHSQILLMFEFVCLKLFERAMYELFMTCRANNWHCQRRFPTQYPDIYKWKSDQNLKMGFVGHQTFIGGLCAVLSTFGPLTWRLTSAECSVSTRTTSVKPLLTAMWSAVHMELFRRLTFAPLLNSSRAISAWLLNQRTSQTSTD